MSAFRVLHVTTFLQGGAGRAICDLAIGQQAAGHAVAVVATRTGAPGYLNYPEYLDRLQTAAVPLHLVDSTFTRDVSANLAAVRAVRKRVVLDDLDVVHAHAGTPSLIGLLLASRARRRVAVLQTMHGWGASKTAEQAARDLALLQELDAVVATSEASARWLRGHGIADSLLVTIPCGIAATPPVGSAADRFPEIAAARASGTAVVACIGSVTAQKNQSLLVEALPRILARAPRPVLCVLVGEGPLVPELQARAASLGVAQQCRFLGYQPEAAVVLQLADLLVLPSRGEGQGLAVLEAFRAGVPALVSDIPALTEIVHHADTGYVFAEDRPESLARGVLKALEARPQDRARVAARARDAFLTRYTTEAMLAAHEALYRRLLGSVA